MKHNTETVNEIIFTHCPSRYARRNQKNLLLHALRKQFHTFRDQLLCGAATLGIGSVLLLTAYFFFTQLAQYGWQ